MRSVDYEGRLSSAYAKGRALEPAHLATWLDHFERHAPAPVRLAVDIGAGIGRFTPGLAERFGRAVGVEPSDGMRRQAPMAPGASYVGGAAQALPLRSGAADLALLFFVWHHVRDTGSAAHEVARILRPGGRLLLRTNHGDHMPELWWYRWFPRAAEVDAAMYAPRATTLATFEEAGFDLVDELRIEEPGPSSARASFERLRTRAVSTFEHLTEAEVEEGFAAIERGLATDPPPEPLRAAGPLLVFQLD